MERVPDPCLVVLVGPSGSGKSTWAAAQFAPDEIVSSDALRAVVGRAEDDLDATTDAFAVLDTIVGHRLRRRLTTVVDTLGLDDSRRAQLRALADEHGLPCVAVGFDVPAAVCRERNRARTRPVPADALKQQLARWAEVKGLLELEGFAAVLRPVEVRPVPEHLASSAPLAEAQREAPARLRFGLHLSSFDWCEAGDLGAGLTQVAAAAERAGFDSIWVMDHVRQIPQVGADWDPMLESTTTLAWLAAATQHVRIGALVHAVTFRNVALLGKAVATLDVLSGGRATCGIGAGWYEREHTAYGLDLPPARDRLALLDDALQLLPLLWGPGSPAFEGRVLRVPEAICYPRPLQAHVPVLVGGGGERTTLRLAARHADAVNVLGDAATLRRKVDVLHRHCADVGRDPADIEVTHLAPTLVATDRTSLRDRCDALRPRRLDRDRFAAQVNAGTVEDQVGRFRELADAGLQHAIVSLPDLGLDDPVATVERFAPIIAAFATP